MKTKPAPLARRRVAENETTVDATRISPRHEEVQHTADASVGQATHGCGRQRVIPAPIVNTLRGQP